ncbi:MAG: adenylate/guanylate cyclase domain-containing protein [SAR324 cluster bacterium]|nr:adenylate/guanylate cyclase domain-containing protein [SAR324 cluster bacterium]
MIQYCLRFISISALLWLLCWQPAVAEALIDVTAPVVESGKIDLSNWNFSDDGIVKLHGGWQFFWSVFLTEEEILSGQFEEHRGIISAPGGWNRHQWQGKDVGGIGYGTYFLEIKVNPQEPLMIVFTSVGTAYRLYVNGVYIGGQGKPGKTLEEAIPQLEPLMFELPHTDNLGIVVQVSNYEDWQGGIWDAVLIGHAKDIRERRERNLVLDLFLFGGFLIIGLYHIGLYSLRPKDRSAFYFSMICILIGLRTILVGERYIHHLLPSLEFGLLFKVEYLSFYLTVTAMGLFIHSLFPREFSRKIMFFMVFMGVVFSIIVIVTPPAIYTYTVHTYQVFAMLCGLYFIYSMIFALWRRREGSFIFLIGFSVFFGAAVNDILHANQIIHTGNYASIGLLIFIFCQALLLSIKFSQAFNLVERQADDLFLLNRAANRFVPNQLIQRLGKSSIVDINLGDCIQLNMTILFSDIRDFTTLSETMTPEENFRFLNSYLRHMEPIIHEHGGVIDKYIGDSIMAIFDDPENGVKAAIGMHLKLHEYNEFREKAGYRPVAIGIGINSGELMLGTIGGSYRMEETVISNAVNIAARVEGMTKQYGTTILISENTFYNLKNPTDYKVRLIDNVIAKGKSEPVTIYEVFNGEPPEICELKTQYLKTYENAVALYYMKRFRSAMRQFEVCLKTYPKDKVCQIYLERCQALLDGKATWQEVTELREK